MTLDELLLGEKVVLRSPRDPAWVAQRINQAAGSVFNPFHDGVAGWARFGLLGLHKHIPLFNNGFAPVLSGRIVDDRGGTEIRARYGIHPFTRLFLLVWYGFIAIMFAGVLASVDWPKANAAREVSFLPFLALFGLVPLAFVYVSAKMCDHHYSIMMHFLEVEAQAVRQPDQR